MAALARDPRRALPGASAVAAAAGRAGSFAGLHYYPYDPAFRVAAELRPLEAPPQPVETSGAAPLLFRPFALASFTLAGVGH